jgi:hypothetical protein
MELRASINNWDSKEGEDFKTSFYYYYAIL